MRRKLWIALAAAALPVAGLVVAYHAAPHTVFPALVGMNRSLSGLEERTVRIDRHTVHYLEGGSGETVVLLHGIYAEKDHWVEFARALTPRYRVVAVDLPGFGESTRLEDERYDYAAQLPRLHAVLDSLGIQRAHLAGSSMGGALAGLFAAEHPERVASLAFIGAPHGIDQPRVSSMARRVDAGEVPLVARTAEEHEAMLDMVFAERPFLPGPVLAVSRETALANATSNLRLWREHGFTERRLQAALPRIAAPTLALWGERDSVFDVSGLPTLRHGLRTVEAEALDGVGHLPMMERPGETSARYLRFLATHPTAK